MERSGSTGRGSAGTQRSRGMRGPALHARGLACGERLQREGARSRRESPRGRPLGEAGWTLMEVLVACAMIGILAAIAVPQYTAVALQMRTSAAATHLLSDLNYAREMAQRTGVPHYVDVVTGAGVNYTVKRFAFGASAPQPDDQPVRSQMLGTRLPGVTFSLNGATQDPYGTAVATPTPTGQLVFSARGLPSAASAYFVTSEDGRFAYAVSVTGAGRIRLFTRSGSIWR